MRSVWIITLLYLSVYETDADTKNKIRLQSKDKKKVCMRDIGCFELTDDFKDRTINVLPQDRRLINTQFFLYTRNNPKDKHILIANKPRTLIHSPMDVTLPTKFIVHGFLDTQVFARWQVELKDELMAHDEYNIIIVDWSGGNQLPYTQATANTRVVGAEIAFLINQLQKYVDLDIRTCHIIGHSLGAHIAGYAGERLNKLKRITALDPAQPYFQGMPPSVRIDPTDAEFVDVIHTDADSFLGFGLGMQQLVGHVDFFPNDGRKQPGCETSKRIWSLISDGLIDGIRKVASCSHQRAVDFFTKSINLKNCKHIGHKCSNWTEFLNGNCIGCGPDGSECAVMGLNADKFKVVNPNESVQVFLKTQEGDPFCGHHYRITVYLSEDNERSLKGKIKIVVTDEERKQTTINLREKYEELLPGTNLSLVFVTPSKLSFGEPIEFSWLADKDLFDFNNYKLNVENVEVLPMGQQNDKVQMYYRTTYHQETKGPITDGKKVLMYSRGKWMKL